jgi:benzoyl-CoA reductase/2-hydroxyglutaryl-CoA dehydratase subunit BcrC/BadD/HgdB
VENKNSGNINLELEEELDKFLDELEDELEKKSKEQNEGIITTTSIVIAIPSILKLISKFGSKINSIISKYTGKNTNREEWFNKLSRIADDLHHLYIEPIKSIVNKFIKDKEKSDKISSLIFHLIVAGFLFASGIETIKAIKTKNLSMTTLESALTAIKTGEIKKFVSKFV